MKCRWCVAYEGVHRGFGRKQAGIGFCGGDVAPTGFWPGTRRVFVPKVLEVMEMSRRIWALSRGSCSSRAVFLGGMLVAFGFLSSGLAPLDGGAVLWAQEWRDVLSLSLRAEHSQTRHDGLVQIDTTTAKGLKALWQVLKIRDPNVVDWFVREGAYEALLKAEGEEAEREIDRVLSASGNELAKEAIVYAMIWKLRKEVATREGGNDDRALAEAKYKLRKSRGVDYFALVLPTIDTLDPDGKFLRRIQGLMKDKSPRVRRAAIVGMMNFPAKDNVQILLDNLKKLEKKKKKNFREWVLTRYALETLTGQYYRDRVKDWLRWWDIRKGTFSVRGRVEKEAGDAADASSRTSVLRREGVEITVHMKVAGDGYPVLVLPWEGFEADYFRPYFHGLEEFCKMYYVRVPSLDDYKGLARDQSSNIVRYPTDLLAGALSDLMEESGLKEFGLLAHGWSASHLAMRVTSRFRDRVTHLMMINPWSGGETFEKTFERAKRLGMESKNQELVKGADSRFLEGERPRYVAADGAEAGGMGRAVFNLRFADATEPELGTLRYLYQLPGGASTLIDRGWTARELMKDAKKGLPLMIIAGECSGWMPPGERDKVAAAFERPYVVSLPRSGELPFVSETYRFTAEIEKFLRPATREWKARKKEQGKVSK